MPKLLLSRRPQENECETSFEGALGKLVKNHTEPLHQFALKQVHPRHFQGKSQKKIKKVGPSSIDNYLQNVMKLFAIISITVL